MSVVYNTGVKYSFKKKKNLSFFKVVDGSEGREVQLINRKSLRSLTSQLLAILMSQEEDQVIQGLKVEDLSQHYLTVHGAQLNPCEYGFLSLSELLKSLPYLVEVNGKVERSFTFVSVFYHSFYLYFHVQN